MTHTCSSTTCETAWSSRAGSTGQDERRSTQWAWRSRRCRRRTWTSFGAVAALNARDLDGYLACCTEDLELHSPLEAFVGVYEGRDGIKRWLVDVEDAALELSHRSSGRQSGRQPRGRGVC